jgi:hypothetical protein
MMKIKVDVRTVLQTRNVLAHVNEVRRAGLVDDETVRTLTDAEVRDVRVVAVRSTWVWAPLGGGWAAWYRIVAQDGAPIIAEVRVCPADAVPDDAPGESSARLLGHRATAPRAGVTAELLRRVRVGEYLKEAGDILESMRPFEPLVADRGFTDPPRRGPGRKGHSNEFYAQLADDYVTAIKAGSRSPAADVARRRRLSAPRVRDMLHEARHRGLLTPATMPGRRGPADLTERGRAVLKASTNVPGNVPATSRKRATSVPRQPTRQRKTPQ